MKNIKPGNVRNVLMHLLLFIAIILASAPAVFAQSQLNRISVTERSDQQGYVVRFHLSETIDSSMVAHTESDFIQLAFFNNEIDTTGILPLEDNDVIENYSMFSIDNGLGFEFMLNETQRFRVSSYPDANGRDILLSLERMGDGEQYTANANPIDWSEYGRESAPEVAEDEPGSDPDEEVSTRQEVVATPPDERRLGDSVKKIQSDHGLDRMDRTDPMYTYIRGIYLFEETSAQSRQVLQDSTARESVHPWLNHPYFKPPTQFSESLPIQFYAPRIFISRNDTIPMGQNDGVLWQGKGINTSISFGARYKNDFMEVALRPVFAYSQNEAFGLNPWPSNFMLSDYAMSLTNIDLPQRFGEDPLQTFDLGDSFIEFNYKSWMLGLSNERLWWGPALHNPLLLSNNAPGFKHVSAGTYKPLETSAGDIDFKIFWGGLQESDYFDADSTNNLRYVTGLNLSYSPSFIPGLQVGLAKVAYSYYPQDGLSASDIGMIFRFSQPKPASREEGVADNFFMSMGSIYARWRFPSAGFETYFEWGRNDYRREVRDILAEPELNRGYVFGLLKNYRLTQSKRLLLQIELTNLENSSVTSQQRDNNIWYANDIIRQGFTNHGQSLGASIGPGSSTQQIKLSYYDTWGMVGASARRIAHHQDRHYNYEEYFRKRARFPEFFFLLDRHEIEMRYGIEALVFLPYNFELSAQFFQGNVDNRHNERGRDLSNKHFEFSLRYYFSGMLR